MASAIERSKENANCPIACVNKQHIEQSNKMGLVGVVVVVRFVLFRLFYFHKWVTLFMAYVL